MENDILRKLTAFYESKRISPVNFSCPSYSVCSANSPKFTKASASYVGPHYGSENLPRLLFLSLDSGSGCQNPAKRTAEAVRKGNLDWDIKQSRKNQHWYRTHEMALELLCQFKPELTIDDIVLYFAHANSAKCCQNKCNRRQADSILFENCRGFIPGELKVLSPDIIVTQGTQAMNAIIENFCPYEHKVYWKEVSPYKTKARYERGFIELEPNGKKCLWLQTDHPNCYGRFYPQKAYSWPLYAEKIAQFWSSQNRS